MTDDLRLQGDILLISGDVRGPKGSYDRHLASTLRDRRWEGPRPKPSPRGGSKPPSEI